MTDSVTKNRVKERKKKISYRVSFEYVRLSAVRELFKLLQRNAPLLCPDIESMFIDYGLHTCGNNEETPERFKTIYIKLT